MNPSLVAIGNVIFNPATVILATWDEDGSLLVNLPERNEHVFTGNDAAIAWNCMMEFVSLSKAMPSATVR